jgi:hypothetical protein
LHDPDDIENGSRSDKEEEESLCWCRAEEENASWKLTGFLVLDKIWVSDINRDDAFNWHGKVNGGGIGI